MEEQFDTDLFKIEIEKRPLISDITFPQYKDRVMNRRDCEDVIEIFCPIGDMNEKKNVGK